VPKSLVRAAAVFLAGSLALFSAPGCQTLSRGRTQHIPATSRPGGVKVLVDGTAIGETPINLELKRRDIHVVRFELSGYRPVEVRITKKRPPLGETILTSAFWAPVGSVVLGFPMFLVWYAVDKPEGDMGGMGQAFISAAAGFVVGWVAGTVIDSRLPSNFDLSPQTLFVQMEKADGATDAPFIIVTDLAQLRRVSWIRVALR
jgi:hypothetical protein